jgi:nucleoside phosphorylase
MLTLIDAEFRAVREVFDLKEYVVGTNYAISAQSLDGVYDLIATRSDQWGNVRAGQVLRSILEDFRPRYVFVVGIAGGIQRPADKTPLNVADIVIPNYISYFELKKLISGTTERQLVPYDQPSLYLRRNFAEPLCSIQPDKWTAGLKAPPEACKPKAVIGHLVAGDTLLGDDQSKVQQQVLKDFPTAIAVDMESFGVASEMFNQRVTATYNPQYLVVRGISDLVRPEPKKGEAAPPAANQATRDLWREYAAYVAAKFTRALVTDLLQVSSQAEAKRQIEMEQADV